MRYWLGLQNFYVITRYNHSAMYAMAVWELSQAIAAAPQAHETAVDQRSVLRRGDFDRILRPSRGAIQ